MSTLVNLARARKQKGRAEKAARARENAAKFGRTKGQKRAEDAAEDKARRDLDGKRME